MSGGIAYVYDPDNTFIKRCNLEMVLLERVEEADEVAELHSLISRHTELTDSNAGRAILDSWEHALPKFARVIPKDYKRMMEQIRKVEQTGLTGEAALMAAFEANMRELARVGG
jgi:glutamate synthase domain-containing protein 3